MDKKEASLASTVTSIIKDASMQPSQLRTCAGKIARLHISALKAFFTQYLTNINLYYPQLPTQLHVSFKANAMKLTTCITCFTSAMAVTTAATPADPVENFLTIANQTAVELFHLGCKFKPCLERLAPTIATCGIALAQEEFGKRCF